MPDMPYEEMMRRLRDLAESARSVERDFALQAKEHPDMRETLEQAATNEERYATAIDQAIRLLEGTVTDGLTVEDLRWAEGVADERAYRHAAQVARSKQNATDRAQLELLARTWRARADRFRAAAEALEKLPPLNDRTIGYLAQTMEREGKRDE